MLSALPFLLEQYKAAWEAHDVQVLELIFTDDIVYQEKPGVIFRGLRELTNYWHENKEKQREVQFRILRYIQDGDQLVAEWEADFRHLVKEKVIHLSGMMWLSLQNGKIANFKEFFLLSASS